MQVRIVSAFLLVSSSLLFSSVFCDPNHHHKHNNDFPWQNILSSLGIVIENQTSVISSAEPSDNAHVGNTEHYTSEPTVEILKSETKDGTEIPIVVQNDSNYGFTYDDSGNRRLALGFMIGIPIFGIVILILFCWCICKCCCTKERPGFILMQQNPVQNQQPPAPQIILQQPIINQHAPPAYDEQQKWAHPPPQGPSQWNQPPPQGPPQWDQPPQQGPSQWDQPPQQGPPQWNQPPHGPPQWVPHSMGEQQHYSPNSGFDNPGFNSGVAPPPYNPGKY